MTLIHKAVLRVIAAAIAILAVTPTPVLAQEDSFSYYGDYSVSSDGSVVYGTVTYSDLSGCEHAGYSAYLWMSGPNSASTSWGPDYAFGAELSIPFDGEGDYNVDEIGWVDSCSCGGGGHEAGAGGGLTWHLGFRYTYYTDVDQALPYCYYPHTACSSGTPSCTTGTGMYLGVGPCPNYMKGTWLVGVRGTETRCLVAAGTAAGGPGQCT